MNFYVIFFLDNLSIDDIKPLTSMSLIKPTNITFSDNLNKQHQQQQQQVQHQSNYAPQTTTGSMATTLSPSATSTTISTLLQKLHQPSNVRTLKSGEKNVNQKQDILMKPTTSLSNPPKLKSQKTDAPMLNYIFDSFAPNKHHHHDFR